MAEVAADTRGQRGREGGNKRAETRPKDSLLRSLECKGDRKYGTFIGTLENDNYQLRYNDVRCSVLGSIGLLKGGRQQLSAVKRLCALPS